MTRKQRFNYLLMCVLCFLLANILLLSCVMFSWQWWLLEGVMVYAMQPVINAIRAAYTARRRLHGQDKPGLYQLIDNKAV